MITHKNYFEIEAANNYELGLRKGQLFGGFLRTTLKSEKQVDSWAQWVEQSQAYLDSTAQIFPDLIDEYRGYAQGAGVEFQDVWTLDLLEELSFHHQDKCTTFVASNGFLIGHNEDWAADAQDDLCILRRKIGNHTTFELFYKNGLGGNAMSINSHGVAQSINSLHHTDHQIGVPKNVVARWLSDTSEPEENCKALARLKRASGYHHTLVDSLGTVWSIECSATAYAVTRPKVPFVHTNHYVATNLSPLEGNSDRFGTHLRYDDASRNLQDPMSVDAARALLSDSSRGKRKSIHSNRTIGGMILDMDHMVAFVWLRRERKKGWLSYELNF